MNPIRNIRVLALATLLALPFAAAFADDDAAVPLDAPLDAVEARVFLVPATLVFQRPLDEAAARRSSCRHATAHLPAIRRLATLFEMGTLTRTPLFQRPDVRGVVEFVRADGGTVTMLFQDNYGGKLPVIGVVATTDGGLFRSVPVTGKPALMTDLRAWAVEHGGPGDGSACDVPTVVPADVESRKL